MSAIADLVRRLAAAGASAEVIAIAVDAVEAEGAGLAERRRAERDRKRRQRAASRDLTPDMAGDMADKEADTPPFPNKERSPTPPKEKTPYSPHRRNAVSSGGGNASSRRNAVSSALQPSTTTPSESTPTQTTALAELTTVLDQPHAEAVLAHRRSMRKALSPHAARLLAARFARCAEPNAAADTMIANGWQGFDPTWIEPRASRTAPTARGSWTEALALNSGWPA
jgi:hypothetical protein